ncbi:hypothetical protein LEP1GSC188_2681 [Leptospira weilii serovar Topaz str. LT2116]|uniref:Uncharacterized protein n=1 Tax=Leptospira weilii serovar Topaz str. LT2116 TaxID=1088540 RepID=M3FLH3_9LEPT|nr:hypothetical protein LEP1GSC188_2681 [Leptospira weilii serovar Topaz str. LT2116]
MKWVFSNIISSPSKKSVEFAISKRDFFKEKVFLSEVYGAYWRNFEMNFYVRNT